ncbi:MAG TPA: type II toxin-antitoxin system VapC family toxin [Acetobacteraceae bacterium]|nr:type II toxin-antitoxin system VapC family toxin [Acetobacteraceae bacterium]
MLAVDTNVVVRYLVNDDAAQAARARRLLEREDIFVPLTVLLETEWVLRGVFGFAPAAVTRALRDFAGLARVTVESTASVAIALEWAAGGLDFADALHLAAARPHAGFVSFDKALARAARRLNSGTAREP